LFTRNKTGNLLTADFTHGAQLTHDVCLQLIFTDEENVIHKTGSTQRITMLPEEYRATATARKFGEVRPRSFRDMRADRQTQTLIARVN